jgi:hypothetical protein
MKSSIKDKGATASYFFAYMFIYTLLGFQLVIEGAI